MNPAALSGMALIFISTTDWKTGQSEELTRFIKSLEAYRAANPTRVTRLFLLLQRCGDETTARRCLPEWIDLYITPDRISLSRARNYLLEDEHAGSAIREEDIVAFPDDDSWMPTNTLQFINQAFQQEAALEFWFCRYGSNASPPHVGKAHKPSLQAVISRASSNTMFFRGRLISSIGNFDENLGVGTAINGGEDTEYAIRAYYGARKSVFLDETVVGHRNPNPNFRDRYYPGSFTAILRYAHRSPAGLLAAGRKLVIGIMLLTRRKIDLKDFLVPFRQLQLKYFSDESLGQQ